MGDDSIWKKELTINVGRKKKPAGEQPAAPDAPRVPDEPAEQKTPFWKKEIGGRKKAKAAPAPAEAAAEQEQPRPAPQPVPFWKKEITLGAGKKQPAEPKAVDEDAVPFWKRDLLAPGREKLNDDPDEVPFWKREVSLGRKPQSERPAERAAKPAVADPAELHEPIKAAEAAAAALIADPNAEIEIFFQAPRRAADDQAPPADAPTLPPAPPPSRTAEPAVPPTSAPTSSAPPLPPAAAPVPELPPQPAPAGLEPLPEVPALEVPTLDATPPAPAAPPAPAPGVHAPVPAAELPPLPAEPKVPFWKKEIGGKKKQPAAPAATPALPAAPAAPAASVPFWRKELKLGGRGKGAARPEGEVSIWKKEITFSRKPKDAADTAAWDPGAEEKVPFWKKEIGGKKKAKRPAATAAAASAPTAEEKVPFWKKEIGGKKKRGAQAKSKAARPAKPAKSKGGADVPFWKRDLSLKSLKEIELSLPSRSGGGGVKNAHAKSKRLVGLKVGASQIAAARVVNNGVAELVQLARQPLEQGIVVGGELRDPDALAAQLKAFFARNKLPRKGVRLGIASNRIGVRIFDVAGIQDDKQLGNAIQFRAQEALPIPLDEAVLDYHVLGESTDAEGQPVKRILLVVAYRELVDRYVTACRKAGITLTGIDLEAFALLRALAAPRPEDEPAKAALVGVAIGHDRSTFAVSDGRVCEFTRVLEWGGSALNIAMARALDLAPSEVEGYKRALMLDGPAPVPEGLTQEQWGAALEAVRRQLQSFARELVSSLQFYQNQPGSLGIGEIVVAGGTAHMPGLAEELQRLIGVHVRVGDPLARVKVAKKIGQPEQLGSLAIAIGLGIED